MEEENKEIRMSLSTVLLFIAIVIIVIMGLFIYTLKKDKTVEAQTQSNDLHEINSELQEKNNIDVEPQIQTEYLNETEINSKEKINKYIANTTVPNPETIFDEQIVLIDYTTKYLAGSMEGVDCKKISYTDYSKLLVDNGFRYGENLKEYIDSNKELINDYFYDNYSTDNYNFYRYYDNNEEYIVDLRINENNYVEAIKILTDDSHQGN